MVSLKRSLYASLALAGAMVQALSPRSDEETQLANAYVPPFPEPLTKDQFDTTIKEGLHIIEFYSPYCGHCKQLAPIWKSTWEEFYPESHSLNITFHQVNCVESGDLCSAEDIGYYPNIRLYGPAGFIKEYTGTRTKDAFIKFAREEAMTADNFDFNLLTSKSEYISTKRMMELLAGEEKEVVHLISFWPSDKMRDLNHFSTSNFVGECLGCTAFQKEWNILSNRLSSNNLKLGHFNCESNRKTCENLGFGLLLGSGSKSPKVAMIVPGKTENNVIVYKGTHEFSDYEDFTTRTLDNAVPREVSTNDLHIMQFTLTKPTIAKQFGVIYNSGISSTPEDEALLEHLTEPFADIPGAFLWKNNDQLFSYLYGTYKMALEKLNYNASEPTKLPNMNAFILATMTQVPTFFMVKPNYMMPTVMHSYSSSQVRDVSNVLDWVNENSLSVINELTEENFISMKKFPYESYSKTVVLFINTSDTDSTRQSVEFMNNLLVSIHDYEYLRMNHMYDKVIEQRILKEGQVASLKNTNAENEEIIRMLRKKIPYIDNERVVYTYFDLNKLDLQVAKNMGIDINGRQFQNGDLVILENNGKFFYEQDIFGNALTAVSPYYLKETLATLNLGARPEVKLPKYLIGSPFGSSLRAMDTVHQHGFFGYVFVIIVVVAVVRGRRILQLIARPFISEKSPSNGLPKYKNKD